MVSEEVIVCTDCRSEFTFTASEATFFASKGLTKPRRCKPCRQKRRDAKAAEGGVSASPTSAPTNSRGTQWVGGGEPEDTRRGKKDRRKDRSSDDSGF